MNRTNPAEAQAFSNAAHAAAVCIDAEPDDLGRADEVIRRDKAPEPAVAAVVTVVTHGKVHSLRHLPGSLRHAILLPVGKERECPVRSLKDIRPELFQEIPLP